MRTFANLVLEDSYVLDISVVPYRVHFAMDLVLTPDHPNYLPPSSHEVECYRRGTIQVSGFEAVTWKAANIAPSTDATGERDYGFLDELVLEEEAALFRGDWGEIRVVGGTLSVFFNE